MQVLLVRHGNTFNQGEPPLRVGSKTDLPLTEKGLEQAKSFGAYLSNSDLSISKIYSGPLIRHRQHSEQIANAIGFPLQERIIDQDLQEIDYGLWEGKTDEEIKAAGFTDILESWNIDNTWPPEGVWGETQSQLDTRVKAFLKTIEQDAKENINIVVVTSGGVLRALHNTLKSHITQKMNYDTKVATGNVSSIYMSNQSWKISYWNKNPENIPD